MKSYLFKILQTLFLVIVCLISGMLINDTEFFSASADAQNLPTVIIDAGHGGLTNTIKV